MFLFISLVTSIKDYLEILHKVIESDLTHVYVYTNFGTILTYLIVSFKEFFANFFNHIWSVPIIIPDIASAIISEVPVLDKYFNNAFNFLETVPSFPIEMQWETTQNTGIFWTSVQKFCLGLINSLFLWLPTSVSHLIILRRFVIQGINAGYIAGLGTIIGNIFWIFSILFGLRFFVIPWISFDYFRYILGFVLLIKYMWDCYKERKMVLEDLSKLKIFSFSFLLALIEQTSIFPFVSNISIGPESTILETFPANNLIEFFCIHGAYIFGLLVGSLSLLNFICWFWENPAFKIYMWFLSSFKVSTSFYYKFINFTFLYLTMIATICSVPYFGFDYIYTNPLGFVHEDRLFEPGTRNDPNQKPLLETSFLYTQSSDRNTRIKNGHRSRQERWKKKYDKYRAFDASLYDQGVFNLFTIEDLNYGFDRFWLRRKIKKHGGKFRIARGLLLNFKKQVIRPSIDSKNAPRIDFFRMLFEQAYSPTFHEFSEKNTIGTKLRKESKTTQSPATTGWSSHLPGATATQSLNSNFCQDELEKSSTFLSKNQCEKLKVQNFIPTMRNMGISHVDNLQYHHYISTLRKFDRKFSTRIHKNLKQNSIKFAGAEHRQTKVQGTGVDFIWKNRWNQDNQESNFVNFQQLAKKDQDFLILKTMLKKQEPNTDRLKLLKEILQSKQTGIYNHPFELRNSKLGSEQSITQTKLLHPTKHFIEKEKSFRRKLNFYGVNIYRKLSIENNAPFFRVIMKRLFFNYKPTIRWERTWQMSKQHRYRRKVPRIPRKLLNKQEANVSNGLGPVPSLVVGSNPGWDNKESQLLDKGSTGTEKGLRVGGSYGQDHYNRADTMTTSNALAFSSSTNQYNKQTGDQGYLERLSERINRNSLTTTPTYSYSVLGKRVTRYRNQIYKDVLQHYYFSPLNRLLLKFDVDSFMSRQPKSHFLTKKEEKLLHLRRFLLAEHYDTLRWYTLMQQYRTMQSQIGGTKSLASRIYNQQFAGTFKKIRHLFEVTPSLSDQTILKFDQPLFVEDTGVVVSPYGTTEATTTLGLRSSIGCGDGICPNYKKFGDLENNIFSQNGLSYFHEELLQQPLLTMQSRQKNMNLARSFEENSEKGELPLDFPICQDKNSNLCVQTSFVQRNSNFKFLRKLRKNQFDPELFKNYFKRKVEDTIKREEKNKKKNELLTKRLHKYVIRKDPELLLSDTFFQKTLKRLKKIFKFDMKYLQAREKNEEFWREKTFLSRSKSNTLKYLVKNNRLLGYFRRARNQKTSRETKFERDPRGSIIQMKGPNKKIIRVEDSPENIRKRIRIFENKKLIFQKPQGNLQIEQEKTTQETNKDLKSFFSTGFKKEPKRQKKDELKTNELVTKKLEGNFYIKKGKVYFHKKTLADIFKVQKNTVTKPRIYKKIKNVNFSTIFSLSKLRNRSTHVRQSWRRGTPKKRGAPRSAYMESFVMEKINKKYKKFKRINTKVKLDNWWWKTEQNLQIRPVLPSFPVSSNTNDNIQKTTKEELILQKNLHMLAKIKNPAPKTIPFYVGWDESLRKFVITNILLSRQEIQNSFLEGLNFHTTVYWRFPFSTYDMDQFFLPGRQGFAPITWRRFEFRQTLFKTWKKLQSKILSSSGQSQNNKTKYQPIEQIRLELKSLEGPSQLAETIVPVQHVFSGTIGATKTSSEQKSTQSSTRLPVGLLDVVVRTNLVPASINNMKSVRFKHSSTKLGKIRFIQRRFGRLSRNTPGKPLLSIAGPLLNQVLPTHYLYVFTQENRFNSDRYISPRFRRFKQESEQKFEIIKDFTLQRRIQPKRKYHRNENRQKQKNIVEQILPRRRRFFGQNGDPERWRPSSKKRFNIRSRKNIIASQEDVYRKKQIRRRIWRGVIKLNSNFTRPYSGGFVWPGDYLRLARKKIPKFQRFDRFKSKRFKTNKTKNKLLVNQRKIKKMKKKNVSDYVQYITQPKKYLLERHNLKVIKNKLEKAQRIF